MRKMIVLLAAVMPATLVVPSAAASPSTGRDAVAAPVGRLAYVTSSGELDLVTVDAAGSVASTQSIGPVTTPAGGTATVYGPLASPGGGWLAWTEQDKVGSHFSSWIVMRPGGDGTPVKINTSKNDAAPVGFVGQRLVVSNLDGKAWVVATNGTRPVLRLVASSRDDSTFWGTDPAGIVYQRGFGLPGKPVRIDLLSLRGRSTPLHTFPGSMFKGRRAPLEQGWVDPDGRKVIFEQGDHTDFGGVGPISEAYSISGLHASKAASLGHPGAASPIQRMEGLSYAADTPYAIWATTESQTPAGSVYVDDGHGWQLYASDSLVVAGNRSGAVITQPAKYVDAGLDFPAYNVQPTGDAVLHVDGTTPTVPIQATAMVWLD